MAKQNFGGGDAAPWQKMKTRETCTRRADATSFQAICRRGRRGNGMGPDASASRKAACSDGLGIKALANVRRSRCMKLPSTWTINDECDISTPQTWMRHPQGRRLKPHQIYPLRSHHGPTPISHQIAFPSPSTAACSLQPSPPLPAAPCSAT